MGKNKIDKKKNKKSDKKKGDKSNSKNQPKLTIEDLDKKIKRL